jgi:CDP-2,3-bis-(O-geranylgeranyl)-sn-glycerol synthase
MDPVNILRALWIFLPAYVANMAPVLVAKIIPGWKAPIDGGRVGKDGHRILGPGKTWRGLAGGAVFGALTALIVSIGAQSWGLMDGWDYGAGGYDGGALGESLCADTTKCDRPAAAWWAVLLFGALVGAMALVGDAVKSYFKRRVGKERGASWFPFDQLDFVVFGLLAFAVGAPLLPNGWVAAALLDDWIVLATLLVLTPLLHFLVNVLGYLLKLKEVPW